MYGRSSAYTCHGGVSGGIINQVIYHRGEYMGHRVSRPIQPSAATALPSTLELESKGMAAPLEKATVPFICFKCN